MWLGSEPTSKPARQPFSQVVRSSAFTARSRRWSTQPNAAVRPVEAALQNAFKSQAAMMERMTKVALDAAEKSTEVSTKWTRPLWKRRTMPRPRRSARWRRSQRPRCRGQEIRQQIVSRRVASPHCGPAMRGWCRQRPTKTLSQNSPRLVHAIALLKMLTAESRNSKHPKSVSQIVINS